MKASSISAHQRHQAAATPRFANIFRRDLHSHYVEPAWCSAKLFQVEDFGAPGARILDPACGWGRILESARDAGFSVVGSDLIDRRDDPHAFSDFRFSICDFLKSSPVRSAWSVVCNPPFDHIQEFCERAIEIATFKAAMLLPLRRLPAAHWLERLPLQRIYLLTPRPSMPPASYIAAGKKPGGGSQDYCWIILSKRQRIDYQPPRRLCWLHRDRVQP
jgi:hypothetical protein